MFLTALLTLNGNVSNIGIRKMFLTLEFLELLEDRRLGRLVEKHEVQIKSVLVNGRQSRLDEFDHSVKVLLVQVLDRQQVVVYEQLVQQVLEIAVLIEKPLNLQKALDHGYLTASQHPNHVTEDGLGKLIVAIERIAERSSHTRIQQIVDRPERVEAAEHRAQFGDRPR